MIYFVQGVNGGPIKIGYTRGSAERRMKDLQVGSPVPLRLLATIAAPNEYELKLHAHFAHARLHGEWFNPVPELVAIAQGVDYDERAAWEWPLPEEEVRKLPSPLVLPFPLDDVNEEDRDLLTALILLDEGWGVTVAELRAAGLWGSPSYVVRGLRRLRLAGHVTVGDTTPPSGACAYRAKRSTLRVQRETETGV